MEAPDKIYIQQDMINNLILEKQEFDDDVVYIRKDVLLEWAKEKLNEYKQMDEDFQGDVFIGNRHAFAEVIAKIESL